MSQPRAKRDEWPALLLPLLSLVAIAPLIFHGPSCGHDFGFHLQSWMDAGAQLRHGHLLPRWAFSPAYNAGEPRFLFYPPLSWLLGSFLLLAVPNEAAPIAFTWLALTGAASAMYLLARLYSSRRGSLLAAAAYIGNPYIIFSAFERTAFAELLAAAWVPLLFRAALTPELDPVAIALPLALLWLTNAPAAVMGTYTLVLLVLLRTATAWFSQRRTSHQGVATHAKRAKLKPMLAKAAGGLALGLALPGFYLVPAAFERRYVQIAMVIIPNMRVEDNFLFGHTGYGPHDAVLHTASLVALAVMGVTTLALGAAAVQSRTRSPATPPPATPSPATPPIATPPPEERTALPALSVLAGLMFLLLWPVTLPIWHFVPELAFLQFPWRLLAVLGCVFGLAVALALPRVRLSWSFTALLALGIVGAATALTYPPFRQGCEAEELPAACLARFRTLHGVAPTDEYTPTDADNDQLRWDDPAWWLAANPNAPGPHTVPNPAATILDYDQPPPMEQTLSGRAPTHLRLHLDRPEDLILNLRDYPAWLVTLNGREHPPHLQRDDGLLALALPAGDDTVDIRWRTLPDVWAGDALSLLALGAAVFLRLRSRRIRS